MTLFAELKALTEQYLPPDKVALLECAFHLAERAHAGQVRSSGEPYVSHPVAVSAILAKMRLDHETLIAAMLHDVIEDTPVGYTELEEQFGHSVAELVEGVSKLDKLKFRNRKEAQVENFRKMILAMVQDIRVILIKLADRTHNMRTLGSLRAEKQRRIARETLEIYAPLANRLGIHHLKIELEELSFKALHPNRYEVISRVVQVARGNRKEMIKSIKEDIQQRLQKVGISVLVSGHEKSLFAIYQKMKLKEQRFESIMDIYAFRIIVKDIDSCYRTLGQIHTLYKPRPGRFRDHVAIPKANGYQALHTSTIGPHGVPIEVCIRSEDMDQMAEKGVAAYWVDDTEESNNQGTNTSVQLKAQRWIQSLIELQQSAGNSQEFIDSVKSELFPDEIYVFTPKGRIVELPVGATPVDFAYAVHSDVGQHCVGARVDRQPYPLSQRLLTGQTVEIITAPDSKPSASWLNFVVSSRARAKIRHALKAFKRTDSVNLGRRLLNYALGNVKFECIDTEIVQQALHRLKLETVDELLIEIGLGNLIGAMVAKLLLSPEENTSVIMQEHNKLIIQGADGILLSLAKCCHPIYGDPIIGFVSPGKGLVIHHALCGNVIGHEKEPDKFINVQWMPQLKQDFIAELRLDALDGPKLLPQIVACISGENSNIHSLNIQDREGQMKLISMLLDVKDHNHLSGIIRKLSMIEEISRVVRYINH